MRGDSGASASRRLHPFASEFRPVAFLLILRFALVFLCLGAVTVYAGDNSFEQNFNYDAETTLANSIAVADFDGDGEPEVARATRTLDDAGIVRVEVDYTSQPEKVFLVHSNEPLGVSAADVDSDGDPDLLFGSALTGATTAVWLNDGAGDLAPAGIELAPVRFRSCHSIARNASRLRERAADAYSPETPDLVGWHAFDARPVPVACLRAISCTRSISPVWSSLALRGPPTSPVQS